MSPAAPASLLLVKAVATVDGAVGLGGLVAVVLGAEVPDGALIAVGMFLAATVTGILGWALITLWNVSQVVAKAGERLADHDRRLAHLEENI